MHFPDPQATINEPKGSPTVSIPPTLEEIEAPFCSRLQADERFALCTTGQGTTPFSSAIRMEIERQLAQRLSRRLTLFVDNTDTFHHPPHNADQNNQARQ